MARALVTGGLGFLGSHLADRLLALGRDVVIVDNGSTAVVKSGCYRDLCEVVLSDIAAYEPGEDAGFDEIFHLADIAGPYRILEYAGTIGPRSLAGINSVLCLATPRRTTFVFVSSSEVYGRAGCYPESAPATIYTPYTIRLEYAVSKSLCEIAALNYGKRTGLDVKVIRPFNIAGPRQSGAGGFVLPRFFSAALSGQPLTVFGDGSQARCFTHVHDTVESIIRVAESDASGEIFNSGNPSNKTTILSLAESVKHLCRSDSPLEFTDPRDIFGEHYAESFDKVPDTAKIEHDLGWRAERSLDDVLRDTLEYYSARLGDSTPPPGEEVS
jgi:UDP-glucose 4-epimerase